MRTITRTLLAATALTSAISAAAQAQTASDDAIVVLGERLEETTPQELAKYGSRIETISGEQVDQAGYNDASQALQMLVPGLYVAPKSGAFDYVSVSLLGSRTKDVLFTVDGVRISNRLYASTTPLDTLPAHQIESIEVLKGGQSLYYGTQAVGGIVNINTLGFQRGTDGAIEAGYDTNEGYHINGYARGGSGDHYFTGYASHDEAEGFSPFRDQDYQPSQTDRKRGYDVTTLGGRYAFQPSDNFRLSASYQHTDAKLDFAGAEDVAINRNDRNEEIASLKIDWSPTERLDLYLKGYWHDWDTHYVQFYNQLGANGQPNGTLLQQYNGEIWAYEDRGVNLLAEYALTENVSLVGGYDFQSYSGRDDVFLIAPQSEEVHAPFAQVKLDVGGLSLAAGLRHNMPSGGKDMTVWNVSGRYALDGGLFVRGQAGTSFRLPDAYELYVIDPCCETGNPNLVGEESLNFEGGVGYAANGLSAELLGFWRKVDNLIDITYDLPTYPDGFLINTDASVRVRGAELIVGWQVSPVLGVTFDYTHTVSEAEGSDQQLQDIPRDQAKLILQAQAPSGRFGALASVNYVGDVFDTVGGGVGRVEHGNYAVVDLSAWAFIDADKRHRIGLRLENLFDEEYATRVTRVRRDVGGTSYGAENLGTPLTAHVTYRLSL